MAHIDFWAENRTRFKMLIIIVKKKSTKALAYHKPQVATFLCIDVENDRWIFLLRENAKFWFKDVQNA